MDAVLPGALAWSGTDLPTGLLDLVPDPTTVTFGAVRVAYWGLQPVPSTPFALLLSRVVRVVDGAVAPERAAERARRSSDELAALLPPFAALTQSQGAIAIAADGVGFRQMYHSGSGTSGIPVVSTSALLAGRARRARLDPVGVAVQANLGWQLGQRTMLEGIRKLEPGASAQVADDGLLLIPGKASALRPLDLPRAVVEAASLLRRSLEAVLDDHPDAVLQLTGGLDSRLLLSAIPPSRRKGLHAMTLGVPGSGDVDVAARISRRYGIVHEVRGLADLSGLEPEEAWDLCLGSAMRLDATADPVAHTALRVAERGFDQGVRISGLGGEVARGFYYLGRVRPRSYSSRDAKKLAAWRMFVNEAVEPDLLDEEFAAWARHAAENEVHSGLLAGGSEWFRATDELYLRHRMQRWAGATDTAVGFDRTVINPMLDPEFLSIATRLEPEDKAHSRFLALLQMELDPELGHLQLEGRPSPATYAYPSVRNRAQQARHTGLRFTGKLSQRVRRQNRPPAGGTVLASGVVQWWREHPDLLAPLDGLGFLRREWLDDMLERRLEPRPSSVGFLVNLVAATGTGSISSS